MIRILLFLTLSLKHGYMHVQVKARSTLRRLIATCPPARATPRGAWSSYIHICWGYPRSSFLPTLESMCFPCLLTCTVGTAHPTTTPGTSGRRGMGGKSSKHSPVPPPSPAIQFLAPLPPRLTCRSVPHRQSNCTGAGTSSRGALTC